MLHVAEFNDLNRLDALRLLWKQLWQKTRQASFRQSFEYFEHFCRQHESTIIPEVLYVSIAQRPIGILPLILRRRETSLGRLRVMSYPVDSETTTFGPIGPNSSATLSSVMRHLRATRRDWDVINLYGIDSDGLDRGRTHNALTLHGYRARRTA
jgi:CelD/BcsL family acetyltransferase involved in cellulose biosynthesis